MLIGKVTDSVGRSLHLLTVVCDTCGIWGECYEHERPVICGYCRHEVRLPDIGKDTENVTT